MQLGPLGIDGAFIIEPEWIDDERGSFLRTYDADAFEAAGLELVGAECSLSTNVAISTWRGLHHQAAPHEEAKLVRCVQGRIFDVALDLRPDSPTFRAIATIELSTANMRAVYLPPGVAHGYLTLTERADVTYQMSMPHHPESARGVRWNDPSLQLELPGPVDIVSPRDESFPDLGWIDYGEQGNTFRS